MEAETNVVWWLRTKVLPEQLADIFYSVRGVTWLLPTCAWFSWRFSLLLLMAAIHCACNGKWLPALRSSRLAKTRKDLFCTYYAISRNLTSRSCESLCFSKLQPSFAESALSRFSNGSQGNQGGYVCSRVGLSANFCSKTKESDNQLNQSPITHLPTEKTETTMRASSLMIRIFLAVMRLMRWAGQSLYISPMSTWTCGKMPGKNLSCA